jgi:hypothetical protein
MGMTLRVVVDLVIEKVQPSSRLGRRGADGKENVQRDRDLDALACGPVEE